MNISQYESSNFTDANNRTNSLLSITLLALKLSIILISSVTNLLIIYLFVFKIKKIATFSNSLFLSIAISDFFISSLGMSTQLFNDFFSSWPFSDKISCLVTVFIQYAFNDQEIFALMILTMHRYHQLYHPHSVTERLDSQNKFNVFKLVTPWAVSFIFWITAIIVFYLYDIIDYNECMINPSFLFVILKVSLSGYLPLFLTLVFNGLCIRSLIQKRKKFQKNNLKVQKFNVIDFTVLIFSTDHVSNKYETSLRKRNSGLNKTEKAALCILCVSLSMFFTQIVNLITWPITRYDNRNRDFDNLLFSFYQLGVWLIYLTSLFDSLIVILFHEKIKSELLKLFSQRNSRNSK